MKEMSFKFGVKCRGNDTVGDGSEGGDCDEVICAG